MMIEINKPFIKIVIMDIVTLSIGLFSLIFFKSWILFLVSIITVLLPWIVPHIRKKKLNNEGIE